MKNPINDNKWMKDYKDMPNIKELLEIKDAKGNMWVNLYSYNTIKEDVSASVSREKSTDRELWIFVQSLIVDKCNRSKIISLIHTEGLEGRHSMENSDSYSVFYREFYWSDLYKSEIRDYGYFNRPYHTNHHETLFNVQPTYIPYVEESSSDQSIEDSINIIMPSEYLYNGLNMHFGEGEGVWKNKKGEIICVDNSIYDNGSQALLVRKDALLAYLKRVSKVIVWPILMERTLKSSSTYWPRHQAGGYVWMDSNGKFHYRFRLYVPSFMDKQKAKFYRHFPNYNSDKALLLHKLHIKRLSEDEIFQIQLNRMSIEDHNKYWQKKFGIIDFDKDLIVDKNK
jgi:hypothetical protein